MTKLVLGDFLYIEYAKYLHKKYSPITNDLYVWNKDWWLNMQNYFSHSNFDVKLS